MICHEQHGAEPQTPDPDKLSHLCGGLACSRDMASYCNTKDYSVTTKLRLPEEKPEMQISDVGYIKV
jgi:hypothetical protein